MVQGWRGAAGQRLQVDVSPGCRCIGDECRAVCRLPEGRIMYAREHTAYAPAHTSRAQSKCCQRSGTYAPAHTISKQQPGAVRRLKCPSGHAVARMRAGRRRRVGCVDPDSEWSPMGTRAHHTDASRNRRCRKGLGAVAAHERDDRAALPELNAFRVAVPRTGVTKRCSGCNRSGGSCTHGAPGSMPFPQRTITRARGPHRSGGSRTCSRSAGRGAARVERSR